MIKIHSIISDSCKACDSWKRKLEIVANDNIQYQVYLLNDGGEFIEQYIEEMKGVPFTVIEKDGTIVEKMTGDLRLDLFIEKLDKMK